MEGGTENDEPLSQKVLYKVRPGRMREVVRVAVPTQTTEGALENAYEEQIMANASNIGEVLTTIGELFETPKVGQDEWTIAVVSQLLKLESLTEEVNSFIAPEKYKETHGYYLLAMDEFAEVVRQLPKAIDNMDIVMIETATIHMSQGGYYITKATESMK